jgi:hypothetical protein
MKYYRTIAFLALFALACCLHFFLPTEDEREASKRSQIGQRNFLEQQLVGKWNHDDFPAGMENGRYYHLLSADASYTYRGSDASKTDGGSWSVRVADSVLHLDRGLAENSSAYKIEAIGPNRIVLRRIEPDTLARLSTWFRHP